MVSDRPPPTFLPTCIHAHGFWTVNIPYVASAPAVFLSCYAIGVSHQ
jgi:hypothetical protein